MSVKLEDLLRRRIAVRDDVRLGLPYTTKVSLSVSRSNIQRGSLARRTVGTKPSNETRFSGLSSCLIFLPIVDLSSDWSRSKSSRRLARELRDEDKRLKPFCSRKPQTTLVTNALTFGQSCVARTTVSGDSLASKVGAGRTSNSTDSPSLPSQTTSPGKTTKLSAYTGLRIAFRGLRSLPGPRGILIGDAPESPGSVSACARSAKEESAKRSLMSVWRSELEETSGRRLIERYSVEREWVAAREMKPLRRSEPDSAAMAVGVLRRADPCSWAKRSSSEPA